jgi:putative phosphoesterase
MSTTQKIVILADTHVGDRTDKLDPSLLAAIRKEQPDQILHAGDVCQPEVIQQLENIAPTLAVQGNRDWFLGYKLPKDHRLEVNGLKIVLAHGHFSIWDWFWNYVHLFLSRKPQKNSFYQNKLARLYPEADLIIFGHLHYPIDEKLFGKHFLNPGVGYPEWRNNFHPSYITLTIEADGTYKTCLKIVNLRSEETV